MEKEFKIFISDFWSYKIEKIRLESTLDDLGMYADDKKDFLNSLFQKFDIKFNNMEFDKFCEP